MELTISRGGMQVFAADPTFGDCDSPFCAPGGLGNRDSVHRSDDLDGDGEPEVIVDLYTGGAHCCYVSRFYRWDGTTYVPADRNFGDPGYNIDDLDGDGVKELIGADYRFGYAFTAFAFSLMPVRIYDLRAGKWEVVTTRFPDRIRADAKARVEDVHEDLAQRGAARRDRRLDRRPADARPAQVRDAHAEPPRPPGPPARRRLPAEGPAQVRAQPPEVPCQARLLSAGARRSR